MTLLLLENFESLNTIDEKYVNSSVSNNTVSTTQFRSGSKSLKCASSSYNVALQLPSIIQTGVIGFAMYLAEENISLGSYVQPFVSFKISGLTQVSVLAAVNHSFKIYAYSTFIEDTIGNLFKYGRWHYVEIKFNISNSVSLDTFVIKIDGAVVHTLTTGSDTQKQTATGINSIHLSAMYSGKTVYFDDIYILDLTGTVNNDFLGPVSSELILPNADGNYSQFVGSDGNSINNYQQVDSIGADYNEATVSGYRDSYNLAAMAGTPSLIHGVQGNARCIKDDSGTKQGRIFIRQNSTDYDGGLQTLGESDTEHSEIWEEDPDTAAAWIQAGVDSAEIGIKVE